MTKKAQNNTSYLDKINFPADMKNLKPAQLKALAGEVRSFLLENVAETGGHLASNLGVVELAVALHFCYNTPDDKIVWDVGHQSYAHKILTGRKDSFHTLRKLGGLSGFPRPDESEYDAFAAGHSSTSISAALGIAAARDLTGRSFDVAAVIGDGSMTGGLAFEALNNTGQSNTRLLVILNDNNMSISENVGAMAKYLNKLRSAPLYQGAKRDVRRVLESIPVAGKPIREAIEHVKGGVRHLLVPGTLFEELGFTYIGPADGHNIGELIKIINNCRKIEGPVLLHVMTQKGRGYGKAENSPEIYHGVDKFSVSRGVRKSSKQGETYSDIFGKTLVALAEKDEKIVAVTASMGAGTGLAPFAAKFPDRMFDVGIAEGHAATFCAGLATGGLRPVFAVYSSFMQRAYDQILHDVCLQKLPVVFAVDRAGVVGPDGETHQGLFDLSFLSHMPNMTVLAPACGHELERMLEYALSLGSPAAIRYPKSGRVQGGCFHDDADEVIYGEGRLIRQGENIAIVSVGAMLETAMQVCEKLKNDGAAAALYDARFVKPISERFINELKHYNHIFTIEDNVLTGGYGMALSHKIGGVSCFAFPDKFISHGAREEIMRLYGLDADGIFTEITKIMEAVVING